MRMIRVSLGVGGVVALVAALLALTSASVVAQNDPFLGTWVLNVAKSKYTPGPPANDQTVVYTAVGQAVKVDAKGTDAAGKPTTTLYTAGYDGKDYMVSGNPDYDMTSLKRVNANRVEFTRKKNGKVVQTGTNIVSADGKTRTVTVTGVNAQGQKINNVTVYDRK